MNDVPLYPLFLHLRSLPVLIVGGGGVAARKAATLIGAGARITVVSPEMHHDLAAHKRITHVDALYRRAHMTLKPWRLVFAATDEKTVNAAVQKDARRERILCCRCDEPRLGDFTGGSTAYRHPVTLALSTAGASPTLANRLREQATSALDPVLLQLADLHQAWRAQIKRDVKSLHVRSELLKRLGSEEMEAHLRTHGPAAAEKLFSRWLATAQKKATHAG